MWSEGAAGVSKQDALDAFASRVVNSRYTPKDERLQMAVQSLLGSMPEPNKKIRISTSGQLKPDGTGRVMVCVDME